MGTRGHRLSRVRETAARHPILLASGTGAFLGLLAFYPYLIGSYVLMHPGTAHPALFGSDGKGLTGLYLAARQSFHGHLLLLKMFFGTFGFLTGTLAGLYVRQRRRYEAELQERTRREAAVETLQQLMVTLSHYLLNAVAVIGGYAQRSLRYVDEADQREAAEVIYKETRKLEAVVASLQALTEIKLELYREGGKMRMLDIQRELQERLRNHDPETDIAAPVHGKGEP